MTTKETAAEISRLLELCNLRQLGLVLRMVQSTLRRRAGSSHA